MKNVETSKERNSWNRQIVVKRYILKCIYTSDNIIKGKL